tara:strand:+ start:700 stop:999 length:300 start_codon:yes stop_codon:yes gene_type:complete
MKRPIKTFKMQRMVYKARNMPYITIKRSRLVNYWNDGFKTVKVYFTNDKQNGPYFIDLTEVKEKAELTTQEYKKGYPVEAYLFTKPLLETMTIETQNVL